MQIDELSEACKILIDRFNELGRRWFVYGGVASDSPRHIIETTEIAVTKE
ncbi:MAG: hypothetical protein R3E73_12650 [Porticoccaceae bacterium]